RLCTTSTESIRRSDPAVSDRGPAEAGLSFRALQPRHVVHRSEQSRRRFAAVSNSAADRQRARHQTFQQHQVSILKTQRLITIADQSVSSESVTFSLVSVTKQ